jgi:hypothetical protein
MPVFRALRTGLPVALILLLAAGCQRANRYGPKPIPTTQTMVTAAAVDAPLRN